MTLRISETIHGWLGWCPRGSGAPARTPLLPRQDTRTSTRPVDDLLPMENDVIVDYRSTTTSPLVFIGFVVGVTGMVRLLSWIHPVYSPVLSGIILCGLIITASAAVFYENRKALVKNTTDSLILYRILPWPVVIPKNTITSAEVQDNTPPVPQWLLLLLLLIMVPTASVSILFWEYMQFISGGIASVPFFVYLGVVPCSILFFLGMYCHSRVRLRYPSVLVITTTTGRMIAMYSGTVHGVSGTLGRAG